MKTSGLIVLTSLICLGAALAVSAAPTVPVSALASSILAQGAGTDTTQTTTTKDNGEVTTTKTTTVWYTDPVWLVVGGIGALLVIVLLVGALRGDGHTTVVTR